MGGGLDFGEEGLSLLRGQLLGIVNPAWRFTDENDGRGDDRPGPGSTAGFIDASDEPAIFALESEIGTACGL